MRYMVPPRVGHVVEEPDAQHPTPRVFLMQLPDGEPQLLSGTAALIWVLAAEGEDDVAQALADLLGEPVATVAQATRSYLDTLVAQGLLTKSTGPSPTP